MRKLRWKEAKPSVLQASACVWAAAELQPSSSQLHAGKRRDDPLLRSNQVPPSAPNPVVNLDLQRVLTNGRGPIKSQFWISLLEC